MQKNILTLLFLSVWVAMSAAEKAVRYELPRQQSLQGERLIRHDAYTLSYNLKRLTPTWVAWCLTRERVNGNVRRTDFFDGDPSIDASHRVLHSDYNTSGYDRGHMCPAADNRHSMNAMVQSFYMTNICPQRHSLNTGGWNDLEVQCRSWAKNYGKLYICAGPIYDTGKTIRTIGRRAKYRIAVPHRFFKVVLMVGQNTTKAIGFIYPNDEANRDIRYYAVSVDEVERITGLDFFYQLDDAVEKRVEAECKPAAWGI